MLMFLSSIANEVGMLGVILILIAYYLLSINKISAHTMKYHLLNFAGAWLILYSLYFYWNTASVAIEIAWILISIIGMYRCLFKAAMPTK